MIEPVKTDYDELPYGSYSFHFTHPDHLATVANLFGLFPPDFRSARILELGCGPGGNALSIASRFPNCSVLAIDLSAVQVEEAECIRHNAGLDNLVVRQASILDLPDVITDDYGEFDFIIAHGVHSWVPDVVRQKMLRICGTHLSDHGVAYISYNALPGWNMLRTLRDMLLYHTAHIPDLREKGKQGAQFLGFLRDSIESHKTPYAEFVRDEFKRLEGAAMSYFIHEHLEENNEALYFYQFMNQAVKYGLQYLGEASIESMYVGNFGEKIAGVLATAGDILRVEQYMDFLRNRRFRMTLLCRTGLTLSRNIIPGTIKQFYVSSSLRPAAKEADNDFSADREFNFTTSQQNEVKIQNRIVAAMMTVLAEKEESLTVDVLYSLVSTKVALSENAVATVLDPMLPGFVFNGMLHVAQQPIACPRTPSETPVASRLATAQAERSGIVSNAHGQQVALDDLSRVILPLLDGTRDIRAVCTVVSAMVENKTLSIRDAEKKSPTKQTQFIEDTVRATISTIAKNSLLSA